MSAIMIELTSRPEGFEWVAPTAIADDAVVLLDDVESLGAYSRCSCTASDDNPY